MIVLNFSFKVNTNSAVLDLMQISRQENSQSLLINAVVKEGVLSYQDDLLIEDKNFSIQSLQIENQDAMSAKIGDKVTVEILIDESSLKNLTDFLQKRKKRDI